MHYNASHVFSNMPMAELISRLDPPASIKLQKDENVKVGRIQC